MEYTVYECDLIGHLQPPKNEIEVDRCTTWEAATNRANELKRAKPHRSFTVGMS